MSFGPDTKRKKNSVFHLFFLSVSFFFMFVCEIPFVATSIHSLPFIILFYSHFFSCRIISWGTFASFPLSFDICHQILFFYLPTTKTMESSYTNYVVCCHLSIREKKGEKLKKKHDFSRANKTCTVSYSSRSLFLIDKTEILRISMEMVGIQRKKVAASMVDVGIGISLIAKKRALHFMSKFWEKWREKFNLFVVYQLDNHL